MKKISAIEVEKTSDYLKETLFQEFYKISNFIKKDNLISCDVILNGELYELYILANIEEHLIEEQKYKTFDLKKFIFNKHNTKIVLIPKNFNGFKYDFSEIIRYEYEKNNGCSIHRIKKDHGILSFEDFLLMDYNLYGGKEAKLYAYYTRHEQIDRKDYPNNSNIENEIVYNILFNLNYIKNYGCKNTKATIISEAFRTSKQTNCRVLYGETENIYTTPECIHTVENQEQSMYEILYKKQIQKGYQLKKEQ